MSLRQRVVKGVAWSAGLSVVTQASNFAMSLLLARLLGKQGFGEWGMVQSTVGTIAQVAQLAMATAATRFVAELHHKDHARVGRILGLCSAVTLVTGIVATLALGLTARVVATDVLKAPHLVFGVRESTAYLFFFTINGYQVGALAGLEAFRALATAGAVNGVGSMLLVGTLARVYGLDGALAGMSLAALGNWALHQYFLSSRCREAGIATTYRHIREELPILTGFAIPAALSGVVGGCGVWLSTALLVQQLLGYEQVAVLSAAMSFRAVVLFAPNVITRVSTPLLVNLSGSTARDVYNRAFARNLWVLSGAAVAVAVPLALLAPYLLLAFGRNYTDGAPVVGLLALATVFEIVAVALYQEIFARGAMWWGLSTVVLRAVVLVGVSAALVRALGARGVAWANVAAFASALALTWHIVRSRLPPPPTSSVLGPARAPPPHAEAEGPT